MYYVKAVVKGIAPVCFNRHAEGLQEKIEAGITGGVHTKASAEAEAAERIYSNGNGVYLPSEWFKSAMLQGAQMANLKQGRRGFFSYLKGGGFFVDREIATGHAGQEFMRERWGRIPPGPKGKLVWLRNPGLNAGWEVTFRLLVVDDGIPDQSVKAALDTAGLMVGVGNGRPDFGRFIVTSWERTATEPS